MKTGKPETHARFADLHYQLVDLHDQLCLGKNARPYGSGFALAFVLGVAAWAVISWAVIGWAVFSMTTTPLPQTGPGYETCMTKGC